MSGGGRDAQGPALTIGMPVYNGEAYLEAALSSILAQDYADFELVVCDNASTDRTPLIAAEWASRDPRVRVHRSDTNIGVDLNFDRCVEFARGRYFRWAAADDLVAPGYLGRCVAALEAAPDAVLCQSGVHIIDPTGQVTGLYESGLGDTESGDPARRFAALVLSRHLCTHVFGVMRTQALRATQLLADYYGSDRAFLAELALLGRFVHVPEPLFMNREHPARGSRAMRRKQGSRRGLPLLLLYTDYWRAVSRHVHDRRTRRTCRLHLLRWWFHDWNLARLAAELVAIAFPSVQDLVQRMKLRYYGPLPQVRPIPEGVQPPPPAAATGTSENRPGTTHESRKT